MLETAVKSQISMNHLKRVKLLINRRSLKQDEDRWVTRLHLLRPGFYLISKCDWKSQSPQNQFCRVCVMIRPAFSKKGSLMARLMEA